jgi:CBS domain-containing protein
MSRPASAQDFMAANLVTFTPDMDVMEAVSILVEKRISGAPVVDQHGNLVGMLSEKDCLRVALSAGYHGNWGGRVAEYMNPNVECVSAETSVLDIARRFIEGKYRRYPVLKDNRLVGQISRRDVLKALQSLT